MNVRSFDFWDTLVARQLLRPTDLFALVERISGITGFATARVAAERQARMRGEEITLQEIYRFLPYEGDLARRLSEFEQTLEIQLARPIYANVSAFQEDDAIISDMYLPKETMRRIAASCGLTVRDNRLFVSCEHRKTKHSGELYEHVKRELRLVNHVGDNSYSDVQVASRYGIAAVHYSQSAPNEIERTWDSLPDEGKYLAGILRAARLQCNSPRDVSIARWEVFAEIVAPVLLDFVRWVVSSCISQGITSVFFLSRDGQILCRIAQAYCAAKGFDVQCSYAYASRQALHLPGFVSVLRAATWIFEETRFLSVETIADRTQVDLQSITGLLDSHFDWRADENMTNERRALVKRLLMENPGFEALVRESSERALGSAVAYYRQAGLLEPNVAIVDVGWSGRLQSSLQAIRSKAGVSPRLQGFYFALSKACADRGEHQMSGYIYDPLSGNNRNEWIERYRGMIEFFLEADHPSVVGFSEGALPEFRGEIAAARRDEIRFNQAAILSLVDGALDFESATGINVTSKLAFAVDRLRTFLQFPSRRHAAALEGFLVSEDQYERRFSPLVKRIGLRELFGNPRDPRPFGIWREGTFALSGFGAISQLRIRAAEVRRRFLTRTSG